MKLEQSFEVAAPVEQVWNALIDVEQVAPCLPGAAVSGRNEDGSFNGTFSVKIGPTSASYAGKLLMEEIDEGARTATMQANGTDKRGQGSAKATIVSTVAPAGENRTRVDVSTDYHITGRLARFGRGGMIEDISERLLREFAERLRGMCEGFGPGQGASGQTAQSAPQASAQPAGNGDSAAQPAAEGESASRPAAEGESASRPAGEGDTASEPAGDAASASGPAASVDGAPESVGASSEPPGEALADTRVIPRGVPSEPVGGLSLLSSVLWQRFRRNPILAAFIAGLLMALAVFGRKR